MFGQNLVHYQSFSLSSSIYKNLSQSCNNSLINLACSGPFWENIGPRSFLYGPSAAKSVLSRPRADILPVRPSRLVNKMYMQNVILNFVLRVQLIFIPPRLVRYHPRKPRASTERGR